MAVRSFEQDSVEYQIKKNTRVALFYYRLFRIRLYFVRDRCFRGSMDSEFLLHRSDAIEFKHEVFGPDRTRNRRPMC